MIQIGNKDVVALLMSNKADDINVRNKDDKTPCDVVLQKGKVLPNAL